MKLRQEVRDQINGAQPKLHFRDKADPFSTSSRILAHYSHEHLMTNILKHAGTIVDTQQLLYLADGVSVLAALEEQCNAIAAKEDEAVPVVQAARKESVLPRKGLSKKPPTDRTTEMKAAKRAREAKEDSFIHSANVKRDVKATS